MKIKFLFIILCFSNYLKIILTQAVFASGLNNGEIKVWNFDTGSLVYSLKNHSSSVRSLEYLPNNYLASGDANGKIFIWNLLNKTKHIELIHNGYVRSIILIDSITFASASSNSIKLWCIESFENIITIENAHSSDIIGLNYFSNRLFSVSSDGILKSWENFTFNFEINVTCTVLSFEITLDGILLCGCSNGLIKMFSMLSNYFYPFKTLYQNINVSSLRAVQFGRLISGTNNGSLYVWNYNTNTMALNIFAHGSNIHALEYVDNRTLLSSALGGRIRSWKIDNGNMILHINAGSAVYSLKYFNLIIRSKNNVYNNVFTTTTTARVSTTTASTSALTTKTTTPIKSITDSNFRIAESSQTSLNSFIYSTLKTLQKEFIIDKMKITDLLNILTSQSDINDCLTNCSNNGKCNHDSILDKFFCVCNENYFGSSCKIDLRPCSSNPCLNNGRCSNIKGDKTLNYECQCYGDYYSGRNCEVKIDVCLNETCSNKGQCFDLNHTPKCKCFSMYSGDRCEIESNNLKIIKNVIKLSSIIAIIILNIFYGLCLISDITSAFCNAKKMNRKKNKNDPENINYKRYKFVYIN